MCIRRILSPLFLSFVVSFFSLTSVVFAEPWRNIEFTPPAAMFEYGDGSLLVVDFKAAKGRFSWAQNFSDLSEDALKERLTPDFNASATPLKTLKAEVDLSKSAAILREAIIKNELSEPQLWFLFQQLSADLLTAFVNDFFTYQKTITATTPQNVRFSVTQLLKLLQSVDRAPLALGRYFILVESLPISDPDSQMYAFQEIEALGKLSLYLVPSVVLVRAVLKLLGAPATTDQVKFRSLAFIGDVIEHHQAFLKSNAALAESISTALLGCSTTTCSTEALKDSASALHAAQMIVSGSLVVKEQQPRLSVLEELAKKELVATEREPFPSLIRYQTTARALMVVITNPNSTSSGNPVVFLMQAMDGVISLLKLPLPTTNPDLATSLREAKIGLITSLFALTSKRVKSDQQQKLNHIRTIAETLLQHYDELTKDNGSASSKKLTHAIKSGMATLLGPAIPLLVEVPKSLEKAISLICNLAYLDPDGAVREAAQLSISGVLIKVDTQSDPWIKTLMAQSGAILESLERRLVVDVSAQTELLKQAAAVDAINVESDTDLEKALITLREKRAAFVIHSVGVNAIKWELFAPLLHAGLMPKTKHGEVLTTLSSFMGTYDFEHMNPDRKAKIFEVLFSYLNTREIEPTIMAQALVGVVKILSDPNSEIYDPLKAHLIPHLIAGLQAVARSGEGVFPARDQAFTLAAEDPAISTSPQAQQVLAQLKNWQVGDFSAHSLDDCAKMLAAQNPPDGST